MRFWISLAITVILGITAGITMAVAEFRLWPWEGPYVVPSELVNEPGEAVPAGPAPKVVVEEETYNFGVSDNNATGSYDFVFLNAGTAPLKLTSGGTSCSCTISHLDDSSIPPNESGVVTVEWKVKGNIGLFRHTATIGTNDPNRSRVVLTIEGRTVAAVKASPGDLVFSGVTTGEEVQDEFRVYGYLPEELELTGHELTNPQSADHFEINYEKLTPAEVAEEEEATAGYSVKVRLKSGLPLGRFRQTIRLTTNLPQAPTVDVPVEGSVQSEVKIVGGGWDDRTGVLTLGTVGSGEGTQRTLLIVVGGPHHKEVKFKPIETVPDLLKVDVGDRIEASDSSVSKTPVTISVPQGSRPARYLGPRENQLGRIMIETTHPEARRIRILVRFAVQG